MKGKIKERIRPIKDEIGENTTNENHKAIVEKIVEFTEKRYSPKQLLQFLLKKKTGMVSLLQIIKN